MLLLFLMQKKIGIIVLVSGLDFLSDRVSQLNPGLAGNTNFIL